MLSIDHGVATAGIDGGRRPRTSSTPPSGLTRLVRTVRTKPKQIVFSAALTFLVMGVIGYMVNVVFGAMYTTGNELSTRGLLYPTESEMREVKSLDGVWNFVRSDSNNPSQGIRERWFSDDLSRFRKVIQMPVPSSYNDITEDAELRDHVGTVWYDRKFYVPKSWETNQRVFIRFGSVHYESIVWINGVQVVKHEFGHLPFEADISEHVKYGAENRVTVVCDNVLLQVTVPQGKVINQPTDTGVEIVQTYTFDFFNYAGIHRSVMLYTVPSVFIQDVAVNTDIVADEGRVHYVISSNLNATEQNAVTATIRLIDSNGTVVSTDTAPGPGLTGVAVIPNVKPWWPYLMDPEPAYLYTMEVTLTAKSNEADTMLSDLVYDVYRLKIGVRTIRWNSTSLLINGKPIYFRGFGRHEDSDIRGKGLDMALLTKDFNLLKWVGANAYRTSHYPYSEESMQFADEHGIMIIDECPSVDTENYSQILLEKHKSSIEQLIHRDRNHPSVVMWSVANEPRTGQAAADVYFGSVANYTKSLDSSRPITAAIAIGVNDDRAAKHLDIVSFNRYNAWYQNAGRLNMITNRVIEEAQAWNKKHNKPVLMSEYGADTMEGLHLLPAYIWSEDYQSRVLSQHFKAFDALRKQHFFIGEFLWNFADFKTAQTYTRVGGNKKGIFTRNRQPKSGAYLVRQRYHTLGHELEQSQLPGDLFLYTTDDAVPVSAKNEL